VTQDLRASAPLCEINTAAGDEPVSAPTATSRPLREEEISRRDAESQRAVRGDVFQTGLTGLTGFEKTVEPSETPRAGEVVTKTDFAPIGVENTPRPENPVLPANEASQSTSLPNEASQSTSLPQTGSETREAAPISATAANPAPLRELNTVAVNAPVVPQAGEFVSRGDAEMQRAVGEEVFQTGFEKPAEPSAAQRTGEVVTKPDFAPIGVENTPRPENPVLPANEASQSTSLPQTGSESRTNLCDRCEPRASA